MKEESFGMMLRNLRAEKKLSQFQLGKLIGVSDKAISKWENDYAKPKAISIVRMSEVFSVDLGDLMKTLSVTSAKRRDSHEK